MHIELETPAHIPGIHAVESAAFGRAAEADLVDKIRAKAAVTLSLVALENDEVIGHVLFSPMTLTPACAGLQLVGLGPVAVHPQYQCRGVGAALIEAGLQALQEQGIDAVIVLGHPAYYPRFGFQPADGFNIQCEFKVPSDAFMALELRPGALAGCAGIAHYQPEFAGV